MNKKEFLTRIKFEDKNLLSNIYDKIELCNKINKPVYTNEFLPPSVWKSIINIKSDLGCNIEAYGVFEDSHRKVIAFLPYNNIYNAEKYPVELVKINNKSNFKSLTHADFLGALMAQGIKREKFGDLILQEQSCYVPICNDILMYIKENLIKVGNNPCSIEVIDVLKGQIPNFQFEEKIIIATSLRIDCIVSAFCGISRAVSTELIKKGMVLLDYERVDEKDTYVDFDSIITVRGYGKFKIISSNGKTQREREKILIKKYI